jgi:hypothetical protein
VAFLGSISGVDLERWLQVIGKNPQLVAIPVAKGTNPFTKAAAIYRAGVGDAHVVVGGTQVGSMMWSQDGSHRIAVEGNAELVEPIAVEVASELGGVFQRGI